MDHNTHNAELYLKARLAETDRRPDLHTATASVYNSYLEILRERPQEYAREVGDMFPVLRAEQLDRNENFRSLYDRLKHTERAEAYDARKRAVGESAGYGDLYAKMEEARRRTEPLLAIEDRRRECLQEFAGLLIAWRVAVPGKKSGFAGSIMKKWEELKKLDPQISWERLRLWPPYRRCLYYNEEQFSLLEWWFGEAGA